MTESLLELASGDAILGVSTNGAEALRWRVGPDEILWRADPSVWGQTAPVLFPIVGWTAAGVRHRGQVYPLGLHGFAAARAFRLVDRAADFLRLRLEDDAQTRALYPFAFRFDVVYRLSARALECSLEVCNTGAEALPYAAGLHPGFRFDWNAPAGFVFEKEERASVPIIAPGGLFSAERRPVPLEGRTLALDADLMRQEALCFLDVASRSTELTNGGRRLRFDFADFPHIALWARPPAPYLCVEAWTGYGDPVGFAGDIAEKPSMRALPPGGFARHTARFAVLS
ncbi:MAG: aldose 1-epimerase family protein [Hyphomicrobiales bacterium]|nr:aldose 1-epimerase family protein [Hyphomicrobiales bacterium]